MSILHKVTHSFYYAQKATLKSKKRKGFEGYKSGLLLLAVGNRFFIAKSSQWETDNCTGEGKYI